MCVSVCMCGVCTHIHMYIWKVTLREVAMYLCVCVLCTCVVCIHVVVIPRRHIHLRGLVGLSIEVYNEEQQEGLITLQQSSFVR